MPHTPHRDPRDPCSLFPSQRRARAVARSIAMCLAVIGTAQAAVAARTVVETPESVARALLDDTLAPLLAARGANAVVTMAPSDARRTPAPCTQFNAYVPPGARLVGRTLIGVRCADGSNWQAFVAAEVRIEAPSWTAARALHAGETLAAADLVMTSTPMTQADLDAASGVARNGTANTGRVLASIDGRVAPPLGRVVLRPIAAGRALASADVRDEGRINAGESVRVVYNGDGFSVTSEGRAVAPADPGATIQIRLAGGNVVNGTLRSDHLVELPR